MNNLGVHIWAETDRPNQPVHMLFHFQHPTLCRRQRAIKLKIKMQTGSAIGIVMRREEYNNLPFN